MSKRKNVTVRVINDSSSGHAIRVDLTYDGKTFKVRKVVDATTRYPGFVSDYSPPTDECGTQHSCDWVVWVDNQSGLKIPFTPESDARLSFVLKEDGGVDLLVLKKSVSR